MADEKGHQATDADHLVELLVDGVAYGGFTRGQVGFSIQHLAHSFSLTYIDRWVEGQDSWPIERGNECVVLVDGKKLLTGRVDGTHASHTASTATLRVVGRSLTADLVDCAAVFPPGRWSNQTLDDILKDITKPYGIRPRVFEDKPKPFKRFSLNSGELALLAIQRAAQIRGLFPYCDLHGNLIVGKIGENRTQTKLEAGINILSASRDEDWSGRFSDYIFKGQRAGDDETHGRAASQIKAEVFDDELREAKRYRPYVVIRRAGEGHKYLEKRATWERNRRAGQSDRVVVATSGFRNAEGFWQPNVLAHVTDPWVQLDNEELLITAARYRFGPGVSDSGYVTELELTHPEAFSMEPYRRRRRPKGKKKSGAMSFAALVRQARAQGGFEYKGK